MEFFYVDLVFTLIVVLYKINKAKLNWNYLAIFVDLQFLFFLLGFRYYFALSQFYLRKYKIFLHFLEKKMQLTFHSLLPFGFSSKKYIFK